MAEIGRAAALPRGGTAPDTRGPSTDLGLDMKALAASIAVALLVSLPLRAEDVWNEQRAVPDEAGANAQFGAAASLDGSLALFGADGEDSFKGAAYFYTKGAGGWTELQRITPDDTTAAEFGYRVLLRGDLAIVTADQSSPNNNTAPTSPAHPLIRATPFQESMSQRGTGDQPCHGHGEDRVGGKSRLGARHGGAT